jgi:hypothetical protein
VRVPGSAKPSLTKNDLLMMWPELRYMTRSFILGVRGYWALEGGSLNKRGIFDDAIFVFGRNVFKGFNASTDPDDAQKGRAVLEPGTYEYQIGIHNRSAAPPRRHMALVQAGKVKIKRDGESGTQEGFFGINIHRGGKLRPGSEGCQTIPFEQWPDFIHTVELGVMAIEEISWIHYKLVEYKPEIGVSIKSS